MPAKSRLGLLAQVLAHAVAPPFCCLCGRDARPAVIDLCEHCAACLPRLPAEFDLMDGHRLLAAFTYAHPVDHMVRALKFRGERVHARVLGAALADARASLPHPLPQLVVPLPLHRLRYLERGFDQAEELAQRVARPLRLPVCRDAVRRLRHTAEQSHLGAAARRLNPGAAFAARRDLAGMTVALVDDVLTTGSTAAAAAAALTAAGAAEVEIWVAARAGTTTQVPKVTPFGTVSEGIRKGAEGDFCL